MADKDPKEQIQIAHPKIPDALGTVSRKAFERVWKDKGWTEASEQKIKAVAEASTEKQEG